MEEVEENDTWIDEFRPPEDVRVAVATIKQMEIEMAVIKERLRVLIEKVE
jgi:hypothetical protein